MPGQLKIILVPHTHWDREWYLTFQQFRMRLVQAIDRLLTLLDHDAAFSHFMLDGQTIVLDDYLEVEPEQEERLRGHARAGRLLVGPWYLQPDEFLVSGESLIRNLQIGLKRAAEFGEPMRLGYVPDCFGHIAQLPQILQGCDIPAAAFWRGVGAEARESEFYWSAPDGSKVLVLYLSDGYGNARLLPTDPEQLVTSIELLVAPLVERGVGDTILFMNGSDHLEAQPELPAALGVVNKLLARLEPGGRQIMSRSGEEPYKGVQIRIGTLPEYLGIVQRQITDEGRQLQELSGEMRSSQFAHLLPSVLSTRMWIKQQNTATEQLLEHWVEPLTAWSWRLGAAYPQGLVGLAWKYLLQNQPHDSICGCSIDQVHRENRVRFDQSQQIGEQLVSRSLHYLALHCDTRPSESSEEAVPLVVFNMGPGPSNGAIQARVRVAGSTASAVVVDEAGVVMPHTIVQRHSREIGSRRFPREMLAGITHVKELETPGQFLELAHNMIMIAMGLPDDPGEITRVHVETGPAPGYARVEITIAPHGHIPIVREELLVAESQILALTQREDITMLEFVLFEQDQETLEFLAAGVPANGLKTFWLHPQGRGLAGLTPVAASLQVQERTIENEYFRVEASAADGTLMVLDKLTGARYEGLHRFVDGGDVGDLYNYCPPAEDRLIAAPQEPPSIELLSAGPVRATLRISGLWALPAACSPDRGTRSSKVVACAFSSEVTLAPGVRRIDIHTSIDNQVRDHRLRVTFPVSYRVEEAVAEGTFEVRRRPAIVEQPADPSSWVEQPVSSFPQKRFVAVSDGASGLAVLNRGLPEYEIIEEGPGLEAGQSAIALTLLRCVEWLSRDDLTTRQGHAGPMEYTPEGQCLGPQEFAYALVPFAGAWEGEDGLVLREAQAFNLPMRVVVTTRHAGPLAASTALVDVAPRELVVSALKRSNDGQGMIVRVYNPLERPIEASIQPGFGCKEVFVTNLLEEPLEQLARESDSEAIRVNLRAAGILTLLLR